MNGSSLGFTPCIFEFLNFSNPFFSGGAQKMTSMVVAMDALIPKKIQFQTVVSDGTCVTTYAADPCETECAPEPALLRPE